MTAMAGHRVIVFLQENKTTDFYFPTLAEWGAAVANHGKLLSAPPNFDQPHDRNAWVHYAMGDYPALDVQIDNDTVIPFYSWLAKQFVFCDHHFGAGSNSTPGHMLAIGGQMPTLKNPPFVGPHPVWDIPSIFTAAEAGGVSWAAFPDQGGYPTKFYKSLTVAPGSANVHPPKDFIPMAKAGTLPQVCYVWSPGGYDEHPPHVSDPTYVTKGHDLVWERVQAVIDGGGWADTTFILTWDDWGGYADSVPTPSIETVPDALHPGGFTAIGGSRIPLIMFGGKVRQGIDPNGTPTPASPRPIIDLLGLPGHGRAPGGHVPIPGRARGLHADPSHPPGARIDDHPAQGPAPNTQADTTGPVARAAQPADARPGHPRRQHPAGTHRRTRATQTPQAPEESVTGAGETRRVPDLRAGHLESGTAGSESSPAIHSPSVACRGNRIGCWREAVKAAAG